MKNLWVERDRKCAGFFVSYGVGRVLSGSFLIFFVIEYV